MSATRRMVLMLTVMGAAILLAGGMALAAIIDGTAGDDTIRGTNDPDIIDGMGGNDDIVGLAGSDNIYGRAGQDELFAGNRNQTSKGSGNDTLHGGIGGDLLVGGYGSDSLDGGDGNDRLVEGPWSDESADTLEGGEGDDLISSDNNPGVKDTVLCGPGYDRVRADNADAVASSCEVVVIVQDLIRASRTQSGDFTTQSAGNGDLNCYAPGYFRGFIFGDAPCGTATDVDPGNRLLVGVTSSDGQPVAFRGYGTILGRQVGTEVVVTELSGAELLWEHDGLVGTDVSIEGRVGAFFGRVVDGYWRVDA